MEPLYQGNGAQRGIPDTGLPSVDRARAEEPSGYRADPALRRAVDLSILLGRPLLLTGEPGTGKTQLAYSIAYEFELGAPQRFDTKSTSEAKHLFYRYDALGRFHARNDTGDTLRDGLPFIRYGALGRAVLLSKERVAVERILDEDLRKEHAGPRRSVVLIDEVDKAPRDFPNDLLGEIENMRFHVPELGIDAVEANRDLRPIVIITSNSERNLPDAFLRRCIYHHIEFPQPDRLKEILEGRLGAWAKQGSPFIASALALFDRLRASRPPLRKPPATSELLDWLSVLRKTTPDEIRDPLAHDPGRALETLGVLVKQSDDRRAAGAIVETWRREDMSG